MRTGFKLVLITLPLVAMGVAFVAYTIATKPAPAQEEAGERAIAVRTIEARKIAISVTASGFGLITPSRSHEAIAQVSGTVEYVNPLLKKGDILPAGAVLVRLSDSDYKLAVAQARANIRAAEARLAEIEVSGANLEAGLAIEEETFSLKERELNRIVKLNEVGTASQAAVDGARAAYLVQRQKVQNQKSSLALLPTQRRVQIEQIAVSRATLETAELNVARTELRLPFAARAGAVSVEIGQFIRSGQSVALFDGIDAAEVEAQIPAADLKPLFRPRGADTGQGSLDPAAFANILSETGIQARVMLKLGREYVVWPAVVDRISNSIDPKTGTLGVIVRVDNAYGSAEPGRRPPLTRGMFVEAVLEAPPVEGIAVPRNVLRDGKVMVADAQRRLRLVPVTVAFFRDRVGVVTAGLNEGDSIVVSTPVPLIEGMLLELHTDEELMREIKALGAEE